MKAILRVGDRELMLNVTAAAKIIELCEGGEVYATEWHRGEGENKSFYTHHVYPIDETSPVTLRFVTDEFINVCRLAGKP
jgi:hypothetical protein